MPEALVERARKALDDACVPCSKHTVGATFGAVDGEIYVSCSIEDTNYFNSLHAEEVTVVEAMENGHTKFGRLVVTLGAHDSVTPCGMCRQTLAKFCDGDLPVVYDLGNDDMAGYTLGELLPSIISLDMLEAAAAKRDVDE